jgi:hypothetical protein
VFWITSTFLERIMLAIQGSALFLYGNNAINLSSQTSDPDLVLRLSCLEERTLYVIARGLAAGNGFTGRVCADL